MDFFSETLNTLLNCYCRKVLIQLALKSFFRVVVVVVVVVLVEVVLVLRLLVGMSWEGS